MVGQLGSYRTHILGTLPKSRTSVPRADFQGFLQKSIDPRISTEIANPWFLRHFPGFRQHFLYFAKFQKSPKSTKMVLCGISESAQNARIPALPVFFDTFRILFPCGESHKNPEIQIEAKSSILKNWWGGLRPPPLVTNFSILRIFLRFRFLGSYGIRHRGNGF